VEASVCSDLRELLVRPADSVIVDTRCATTKQHIKAHKGVEFRCTNLFVMGWSSVSCFFCISLPKCCVHPSRINRDSFRVPCAP